MAAIAALFLAEPCDFGIHAMNVFVQGVGLVAPGLSAWEQAQTVLPGIMPYVASELPRINPAVLPAELRRRAGEHIRIAVAVASQAVAHAAVDPTRLASVFASSESDGLVTHQICESVVQNPPLVSPTRFHNSVANAAAGYWSMAVGAMSASTSIAGFDGSFSVGLIEACCQVLTSAKPILLVVHDCPMPEPLQSVRPLVASFAVALVLAPQPLSTAIKKLGLSFVTSETKETPMTDSGLETLRRGNPAARALPFLKGLLGTKEETIVLPYLGAQRLQVVISLCG